MNILSFEWREQPETCQNAPKLKCAKTRSGTPQNRKHLSVGQNTSDSESKASPAPNQPDHEMVLEIKTNIKMILCFPAMLVEPGWPGRGKAKFVARIECAVTGNETKAGTMH